MLSGCEDPGGVGGNIGDTESEVVSDTLIINGIQTVSPNSYSGELEYFSAGQYDDQLFGNLRAIGYLKPNLPAAGDTVHTDATVLMQLMYNSDQVYGNTTSTQGFDIYEIDQLWRDRALMINDDLQLAGQKIGEFTVGTDDSLTVNLSQIAPEWVEEYRAYADAATDTSNSEADSTYRYEAHGLALVPNNSEKIIPLNRESTRFVIQNPEADTFAVSLNRWGYSLERGNSALPEGSVPLHSTYESVLQFDSLGGVSDLDLQISGLARAELVLHQNSPALQPGPPAVERAEETTIYLQLADPENIPENIDPGTLEDGQFKIAGAFSAEDNTYRFDVTNLVARIIRIGLSGDLEFFVTLPNNGIIKSTLIETSADEVPDAFKPKIIITSLKNTSN